MFQDSGDIAASGKTVFFRRGVYSTEDEGDLAVYVVPGHVLLGIVVIGIDQVRLP